MSSPTRVNLQPGLILHTRPYRDTSLLVDIFSQEYGRFSGVVRGARGKKSRIKGLTRPFFPLLLSWYGRSQLMTIHSIEPGGIDYWLTGKSLISGFYLNELLMRLLPLNDPYPAVYTLYLQALAQLHVDSELVEPALRHFEFDLLQALGFGIVFDKVHGSGQAVCSTCFYTVEPDQGVVLVSEPSSYTHPSLCWSGQSLMAIARRDFSLDTTQRDAKQIIRLLLKPLLGHKPLKSRQYYQKFSN